MSRRNITSFKQNEKNIDGRTPVRIQGLATVDEINKLYKLTNTKDKTNLIRALIDEKLYKKVEV